MLKSLEKSPKELYHKINSSFYKYKKFISLRRKNSHLIFKKKRRNYLTGLKKKNQNC
mgnify:CR=1 FL=1